MRLGHRIKLETQDSTVDAMGQRVAGGWRKYRECWANVRSLRGVELRRNEQTEAVADVVIELRYPYQGRMPSPEDRAIYTERGTVRTFHIESVERADNRQRLMKLFAREDV